jgi:hypothetical protein
VTAQRDDGKAECNAALGYLNTSTTPAWRKAGQAASALIVTAHREETFWRARAVSRKLNTGLLGLGITGRL